MSNKGKPQSLHEATDKIMAILDGEAAATAKGGGQPNRRGTAPGGGLPRRMAQELNIPARLAEAGGKYAWAAMTELKQGLDAGGGGLRANHVARAQKYMAKLDPARNGALLQHLQGCVVALGGRGGDTRIAHVTPGEVVIPKSLQTPGLLAELQAAARAQGIDPALIVVGSGRNSINPNTGQPEFQDQSNPYEWEQNGPYPPSAPPPNRLREAINPWIGDNSVFHPLASEQVSQMDNNELGNYDRANGVARTADKGLRAIGTFAMSRLPPPADNFPIFGEAFETPFDKNKETIDAEMQRRRDMGLLK